MTAPARECQPEAAALRQIDDAPALARTRHALQCAKDCLRHYAKIDYDENNDPQPNAAFDVEQICKEALYEMDLANAKAADLVTDWEDVEQRTNFWPLLGAECQVTLTVGVLHDIFITMRHARTFITSREKMHPTGVELWDKLFAQIEALQASSVPLEQSGSGK